MSFKNPSPTHAELNLEYSDSEPGVKLTAKIPFQKRFTNPIGIYQGGMMAACLDETFGPLAYLTAGGPCITISMNVTYLSSFTEQMGHCLVNAIVLKKTKNFIFMRADVVSPSGEIVAHSESHVKIL